jgi:hypothetical protein
VYTAPPPTVIVSGPTYPATCNRNTVVCYNTYGGSGVVCTAGCGAETDTFTNCVFPGDGTVVCRV